jgi:hypothetical protein
MSFPELLRVYHYDNKIRCGVNKDGGYVIGDINHESGYDCYISAGVSNEESFSRDFINKYGLGKHNCFAFDGTIQKYPSKYTKKIQFVKKNISNVTTKNTVNLNGLIDFYNNIFLKMDIEGHEYKWLLSLNETQLKKFKQIAIEFHKINDDGMDVLHSDKIACFEKLNNTHYIIHIHGNNYANRTNNIPDVVEITYIRKDLFQNNIPEFNKQPLPIDKLDYPNNIKKEDYNLKFPPFVNI